MIKKNKESTIIFKISEDMENKIKKECKKAGKTRSEFMRAIVMYAMLYDKDDLRKFMKLF